MVSSTMLILSRVSLHLSVFVLHVRLSCNLHPHEGSDLRDLGGSSSQSRVSNGRSSRDDLRGVELVGVDLARCEGVAGESDRSSTCCSCASNGTSSDWTLLNGRGSGEHASGGRC